MKLNYFLRSFALIALMAVFTNARAADIHVANGATDTELAAALELATDGDVILIDGWVTINAMVHVTKNVTIKAGIDLAGFNGGGNSRLFEIHPDPVDGAKLVFDGLDFIGGNGLQSAPGESTDGGVARIYGGVTEFTGCYFYENQAGRGGAFMITENGTTVTFKNCHAWDNVAKGTGNESRGGYLFADGEVHISHDHCKITNSQSIGGRGGALCIINGTHYFYYTIISNNKAGNWSIDGLQKLDMDGNPVSDGEYEGGAAWIIGGGITFESCAFTDNQSWSHSGIIRGWGNNTNVTFINTTMTRNWSRHDQAPIWNTGGTWTFVNTILADNKGSNAGNGGVFRGGDNSTFLNIFNSVWVRNILDSGEGAQDLIGDLDKVTVKNSIIGLISGDPALITVSDNAAIPTKSILNMYKISVEEAQPDYAVLETSGIDFGQGVKYSTRGMAYYLLTPGSPITKLGDPALLADYDLNTDLFGRTRTPATDGSISAAPTLVETEEEFDDTLTGVINPAIVAQKENIRIIGTVANGILGVDFGDLKGRAKGTLVSITGQEVEKVFDAIVVAKGYYNVHAAPGAYVLKVEIAGKTYAQKLIVTK